MRRLGVDGVSARALLILSAALFTALPATAQEGGSATESTVAAPAAPAAEPAEVTASVPPPAPQTAPVNVEAAVPVPEPANVAPPTRADVPDAAPAAPSATQLVADKLKALVTAKLDRFVEEQKDRAAVQEFYEKRGYAPVLLENGAAGARMNAAIERLQLADFDGLNASDYLVPDVRAAGNDPDRLAQAELALLGSMLTYARHAQAGRVVPSRISINIDMKPQAPEPAVVLKTIADSTDLAASLDSFNPPQPGYKALREKLVERLKLGEERLVQVPNGPVLKRGMKDKRVPLVRQRLKASGDPDSTVFDQELVELVKEFQRNKGLRVTGTLNQATVEALNGGGRSKEIATIVSNMERWRWMPRDLGRSHVQVNIPDFTLHLMHEGEKVFQTRIVVGKKNTPTPVFSDEIENIVVNPSWHVPQSIIYGEYLPAYERDPTVFQRMGLQMTRNRDGSISIRQAPGAGNALGRLKFNLPNKFQVYLHDTPTKHLFAHDKRAYSHGCMRVQYPEQFAAHLLAIALPQERYTVERITRMYGRDEQTLKFRNFIPVHLTYFNAYVNDAGHLVIRDDVYEYDKRTQSALRGHYIVVHERGQEVKPTSVRRDYRPRVVQQEPQYRTSSTPFPFFFPFFR